MANTVNYRCIGACRQQKNSKAYMQNTPADVIFVSFYFFGRCTHRTIGACHVGEHKKRGLFLQAAGYVQRADLNRGRQRSFPVKPVCFQTSLFAFQPCFQPWTSPFPSTPLGKSLAAWRGCLDGSAFGHLFCSHVAKGKTRASDWHWQGDPPTGIASGRASGRAPLADSTSTSRSPETRRTGSAPETTAHGVPSSFKERVPGETGFNYAVPNTTSVVLLPRPMVAVLVAPSLPLAAAAAAAAANKPPPLPVPSLPTRRYH